MRAHSSMFWAPGKTLPASEIETERPLLRIRLAVRRQPRPCEAAGDAADIERDLALPGPHVVAGDDQRGELVEMVGLEA